MRTAFVTGSAGFVGFHVAHRLLKEDWTVIGLDSLSPYYDVTLKTNRHAVLETFPKFQATIGLVEKPGLIADLLATHKPDVVLHLAAQAGVRHSIHAPRDYMSSNAEGTFELLEAAKRHPPKHVLIASSSSVYGAHHKTPYAEADPIQTPMSLYAALKAATEMMAHSYAHLYDLPITMFRFFTVYGPWGRPDMAYFKFAHAILKGEPIDVFNHGEMSRDFTYIDDLVDAVHALIPVVPGAKPISDNDSLSPIAPFRVVNIGADSPVKLMKFISVLEDCIGQPATLNMLPMQAGDVQKTWASTELLKDLTGVSPQVDLRTGIQKFTDWYREYYRV